MPTSSFRRAKFSSATASVSAEYNRVVLVCGHWSEAHSPQESSRTLVQIIRIIILSMSRLLTSNRNNDIHPVHSKA
jgi:hypothetical protein